ncbi:dehydrogenase [Agrobacterium tumefaciens str. Cherry 2E-2-2]|nr:dehydrogenase [Agrobacterium tumefaciens str. Cherry 2E-2-2]
MRATVLYSPGDVRCVEVEDLKIIEPTDAIITLSASCICGSDLWPYRGLQPVNEPFHRGTSIAGSSLRSDRSMVIRIYVKSATQTTSGRAGITLR